MKRLGVKSTRINPDDRYLLIIEKNFFEVRLFYKVCMF